MAEILNEHRPGFTHANKLPHIGSKKDIKQGGQLNENLMNKNAEMSPQRNSGVVIENIR